MKPAIFMSKADTFSGDYSFTFRNAHNEYHAGLHYHDFYEFVIYLGNAGSFFIDNTSYDLHRGDIVLISMFTPHTLRYDPDSSYECFSVSIDPQLLLSFSSESSNILDIFLSDNEHYPVFHLDETSFAQYSRLLERMRGRGLQHGNEIYQRALLHQLCAFLYDDCYNGSHYDSTEAQYIALVAHLIQYINNHLGEDLSLEVLAKECNYSIFHLCKIFKKVTQKTLNNYIIEKRLERVAKLLTTTLPISRIAENTGFHNYSYFYKAFCKVYGQSPIEYRKSHEQDG